jgi:hypothetical protein
MFDLGQLPEEKNYAPLKPGVNIPVILEKIEVTSSTDKSDGGDLDIYFKGTSPENAGGFKPRFWANNFDVNNDKYKEATALNALKQIRQIATSYLSEEAVKSIKGKTWEELRDSFVKAMNSEDFTKIPTKLKVVYKYNSDENLDLPNLGVFISTELNPQALVLSDKCKNGIPYDRVLPLSNYASSTLDIPADENFDFPALEDSPDFG